MLIAFHNHHVQLIFTLCNVETNLYLSDMLWRYPNPFLAQPPPSPLETQVKSGLPGEFLLNHSRTSILIMLQLRNFFIVTMRPLE